MSLANKPEQNRTETELAPTKTEVLEAEGIFARRSVARAAELLRDGKTVAFPTETVYGLGANAFDPVAVECIFAAKGRPAWDPLIVHVCDREMLARVAVVPTGFRGRVFTDLIDAFWPGPLTLLLPRTAAMPDAVTAGRPLVGVRIPALELTRELIRQAGVPIAAPSANRFGHTSPTTAAHVLADLDGRIDAVLDGGPTKVGVESTVVGPDESDDFGLLVYRPGGVTTAMLESVCGVGCCAPYRPGGAEHPASLPSPGVGLRHYAPRARLVLVRGMAESALPMERRLVEAIDEAGGDVGVMLPDGWDSGAAGTVFRWGPWSDPEVLARLLFFGLRMLDDRGVKIIVCPLPEMDGMGEAIRDRLEKAARIS